MVGPGPNTQHRDCMVTDASPLLLLQISRTSTLSCIIRHLQRPPHDLQLLPGQIHHRKAYTVPMSPSVPWQIMLCSPPVWGCWFSVPKPMSLEVVLPFPACSAVSTAHLTLLACALPKSCSPLFQGEETIEEGACG